MSAQKKLVFVMEFNGLKLGRSHLLSIIFINDTSNGGNNFGDKVKQFL